MVRHYVCITHHKVGASRRSLSYEATTTRTVEGPVYTIALEASGMRRDSRPSGSVLMNRSTRRGNRKRVHPKAAEAGRGKERDVAKGQARARSETSMLCERSTKRRSPKGL
jgi:hypothetical protein